ADERPNEVPSDGLIAGWGRLDDQLVFLAADDTALGSPMRGAAGASKANRIRKHALAQSAPLVQVFAAGRLDPDVFIGAEFVRFGYGVDLDFERESAERILKVAVVTGPITDQATMEATSCHVVVIVGRHGSLNGCAGEDALRLGLADALADDLSAALAMVAEMLRRLPPSRFDPLPAAPGAAADDRWRLEFGPSWQPQVTTAVEVVARQPVGMVELLDGAVLDDAVSHKVRRLAEFCDAFALPLVISHAALDRPPEPAALDVDAFDRLREALSQASNPILEIRRGAASLSLDLGVRPVWTLATQGGAGDARAETGDIRSALAEAVALITPRRPKPEDDPRTRSILPRSLQSE
ncbi:MAG: hypothetical protein P8N02_00885, partial [Actinomycetota bacterium]|nr:hypothetical protein [Actinomycetota bacterium]